MKRFSKFLSLAFLIIISGCEMSSEVDVQSDSLKNGAQVLNSIDLDGNTNQELIQPSSRSSKSPDANARKTEFMVSGHMEYYPNDSENTWKKSFNASGNATSARGQIEVKSNFWGDVHGTVLCTYAEGNDAVVAMYITKADNLNLWYNEGTIVWFRLIDNGEGSKAEADQVYSNIWYTDVSFDTIEDAQDYILNTLSCQDLFGFNWIIPRDIQERNFQIK
jgi:hypothetical protein